MKNDRRNAQVVEFVYFILANLIFWRLSYPLWILIEICLDQKKLVKYGPAFLNYLLNKIISAKAPGRFSSSSHSHNFDR
jgi:hypothetical protein